MDSSIVAAIPVSDKTLVVWFDNGVSRRYTAQELGLGEDQSLSEARIDDSAKCLVWNASTSVDIDTLLSTGSEANYVETEKRRLLKSLSEIRRESCFSQTRLGDAAGIRQSVISRIEGCEISPQINTLLKLLAPLGKTLAIVDLKENE
ncbi:MAG: helix-turn-helix domain-containing protein [Atopobiaceae bacterium]|nr:helix-turn-helix domain-containing protein [Atopobiaceae bacterium]